MNLVLFSDRKIPRDLIGRILIFSIVIYPLCFIWQAGDLTDTGFYAYNYQNFFNNFGLGKTESISFLADWVGAVWLNFFPNLGIFGLSLLFLIFYYLSVWLIYLTLRLQFQKSTLLYFGIFCGVVFSVRYCPFVFSRDILSFCLLSAMSYFILKGYLFGKGIYFFLSGFIFILACLSRLPNIVFIVFLPILFYQWKLWNNFNEYPKETSSYAKLFSLFIGGGFISALSFIILLSLFGIDQIFFDNLLFLKDFASNSNHSSYSLNSLVRSYFVETAYHFIPHAIVVWSIAICSIVIYNPENMAKDKFLKYITLLLILYVSYSAYSEFSYLSNIRYLAPALCFPFLFYSILVKDKFAPIAVLGMCITFTQLLGTNTGLYNKMFYGFILLLPLTFLYLKYLKTIKFNNIDFQLRPILFIGATIIIVFSVFIRWGWIFHVDSGVGMRLSALHTIDHPKMRGIFTTKTRSTFIENLTRSISQNTTQNDNLFIFGNEVMFYYLADVKAPINDVWLSNNLITTEELFKKLNSSIEEICSFPVIVDTKRSVMGIKGDIKLHEFLENHNYYQIEDQPRFRIWKKN